MLKFYIVLYCAKLGKLIIKLFGRNASYFPGKFAVTLCRDFLEKVDKPKTIIAVTGTNGKTTVSNLIIESLTKSGYNVLSNKLGANVNSGVASALMDGVTLKNKTKYDIAVLEVDERSSLKIYPYIKPTYIVCTNLFRDSIRRNAHPEYIFGIINSAIPKETTMILNADDLISSQLGEGNKKVYFGIGKQDTDLKESVNIINDLRICPKCHTKLQYNYVRYHHIGNAYCPKCDFKSPISDNLVEKIDYDKNYIIVKDKKGEEQYNLISDSMFNIYNEIAVITVLKELGLTTDQIQNAMKTVKITQSRYQKETINGVDVISNMAKGQNPIACSCVFDYVKKEKSKKEVILILDDFFDNKNSSENLTWIYDCDFEFLNDSSIDKIIVGGKRCNDYYLRLLLAGVPREKIVAVNDERAVSKYLSYSKDRTIYILFEMYDAVVAADVRKEVIKKLTGGDQ